VISATATVEFNPAVLPAIVEAIVRGVSRGAGILREEAQAICPVRSGQLRDSITIAEEVSEPEALVEAVVYTDVEYAPYPEFGTGIRGAASPGAGPYPYSPTWPGMPAQPYMRPALDTGGARVLDAVREEVGGAL
jgi:HK97 gp10 family phage protein